MDIFRSGNRSGKRAIWITGTVTLVCCGMLVIFPDIALYSARKGISLWLSDVLPALLPFFICANFLQNIGVIHFLKSGTFPFAMSVLSGYPMGAKIVGDLRRNDEISLKEAMRLVSFCSTSGPAFIIGAVGVGMLGSELLGVVIALSHYAGAIVNGALYTKRLGRDSCPQKRTAEPDRSGLQESFTDAILVSFRSLGIILAYIVLFMFITDMIQMSGLISMVERPEMRALLKGFFEMTVGCGAVAECSAATGSVKAVLCSAILSWGGLSVMGQTMSMLSGTGVPFRFLFMSKLSHGLFSAGIAFVIALFVL